MYLRLILLVVIFSLFSGVNSRVSLPWSKERHATMVEQVKTYEHDLCVIKYLDVEVSAVVKASGSDQVPIFSYGSLLNKTSALKSIYPETVERYQPALAFGVVKIFDRHIPSITHWGKRVRPNDTAMLNLVYTEDSRDFTNGVLFYVKAEELRNLIQREEGYDLVPVSVVLWNEALDESLKPKVISAYAFMASNRPIGGELVTSRCINPVPGYTHASKEGAAQFGDAFLDVWIATTLLSDRETPFMEWLFDPEVDMK